MAAITILNLGGTYVNGTSINVYEERGENAPFTSLKTFINTYCNDIQVLNIYRCGYDAGSELGPDCSNLFKNCFNLQEVHIIEDECNGGITNVSNMFYNCRNLITVTMSSWTMNNVTNMSSMFYYCRKLINLDVSNWNTSNIINMNNMFSYCYNLTSLNVSNWNTSNVTDMKDMFSQCENLINLDVSKWNTGNVINMGSMFSWCRNLIDLDVSNWNVSNVTGMRHMFYLCDGLKQLDVSNWNTSNVKEIGVMFYACKNLTNLDVSKWNTSKVTEMSSTFSVCRSLESLNLSNWDTSNVTDMGSMFNSCGKLESLNLFNWNTSNVTDMGTMFNSCNNLKTIYVKPREGWNLSNVSDSGGMFSNCYNLIGRKGTTYVSSKTDASYARIDGGPELPGYFCGIYNAAVSNIPIKDAYFRGQKVNKAILGRDLLNLTKTLYEIWLCGGNYYSLTGEPSDWQEYENPVNVLDIASSDKEIMRIREGSQKGGFIASLLVDVSKDGINWTNTWTIDTSTVLGGASTPKIKYLNGQWVITVAKNYTDAADWTEGVSIFYLENNEWKENHFVYYGSDDKTCEYILDIAYFQNHYCIISYSSRRGTILYYTEDFKQSTWNSLKLTFVSSPSGMAVHQDRIMVSGEGSAGTAVLESINLTMGTQTLIREVEDEVYPKYVSLVASDDVLYMISEPELDLAGNKPVLEYSKNGQWTSLELEVGNDTPVRELVSFKNYIIGKVGSLSLIYIPKDNPENYIIDESIQIQDSQKLYYTGVIK